MNFLVHKFKLLVNSVIGIFIKFYYNAKSLSGFTPLSSNNYSDQIVVSLTSYGRRVSATVYYSIVSMLMQTMRPNRIILWLDNNWNDDTVPLKLKSLCKYGVEIRFCDDTRSYKKLIPTLALAPNSIIITIDDDVIYNRNLILSLYTNYTKNPKSIYCTQAMYPKLISDKKFDKYTNWEIVKHSSYNSNKIIFPVGVGAILYPPQSLYSEVSDEKLFLTLCPNADDIWFWIMARLNHTKHTFVHLKRNYYSFDAIYQYLHKNSALTHSNRLENKNDIQLTKVVSHYSNLTSAIVENL